MTVLRLSSPPSTKRYEFSDPVNDPIFQEMGRQASEAMNLAQAARNAPPPPTKPKPIDMPLGDRFEFTALSADGIAHLKKEGLTDEQIMGADLMIQRSQLELSAILGSMNAALMNIRGNLQTAFKKFGPLVATAAELVRLANDQKALDRYHLQVAVRQARINVEAERQTRSYARAERAQEDLSRFRQLPEDFTLNDL